MSLMMSTLVFKLKAFNWSTYRLCNYMNHNPSVEIIQTKNKHVRGNTDTDSTTYNCNSSINQFS